jgi:hypothetical protein
MEDIMKTYMKAILLSVLIVVFVTGSIQKGIRQPR